MRKYNKYAVRQVGQMLEKLCDQPGCNHTSKAFDNAQLNRNVGLHLRVRHGIASRGYVKVADRSPSDLMAVATMNPNEAKKAKKRAYAKAYRKKKRGLVLASNGSIPNIESVRLESCPCCGARFYAAKTQA